RTTLGVERTGNFAAAGARPRPPRSPDGDRARVHAGVGQERGDLHLRAEPRPDHPDAQLRHLFLHAREVDHRHRVIEPNQALTAVDVAEALDQLFVPAAVGVISLGLARGYIAQ